MVFDVITRVVGSEESVSTLIFRRIFLVATDELKLFKFVYNEIFEVVKGVTKRLYIGNIVRNM